MNRIGLWTLIKREMIRSIKVINQVIWPPIIMTLLYVAGLISLMSGLLAELNVRVLHQVGGQRRYKIIERIGFGQDEESR